MMSPAQKIAHFVKLADEARPLNDDEWGSERQIAAENFFFGEFDINFPKLNDERFQDFCLKATTEEMLDEALRLIRHVGGV
jgi:hypothetical protein